MQERIRYIERRKAQRESVAEQVPLQEAKARAEYERMQALSKEATQASEALETSEEEAQEQQDDQDSGQEALPASAAPIYQKDPILRNGLEILADLVLANIG